MNKNNPTKIKHKHKPIKIKITIVLFTPELDISELKLIINTKKII
tara:strand:- start:263 stop:397 length:135 start_codon:yes stop_codon:yes gene_type:complete